MGGGGEDSGGLGAAYAVDRSDGFGIGRRGFRTVGVQRSGGMSNEHSAFKIKIIFLDNFFFV